MSNATLQKLKVFSTTFFVGLIVIVGLTFAWSAQAVIYEPDPDPESSSMDATNYRNESGGAGVTWASIHDNANDTGGYDSGTSFSVRINTGTTTDYFDIIYRSGMVFDLTGNDDITDADICLYQISSVDTASWNLNLGWYAWTPTSNTARTSSDYSAFGTTLLTDEIAFNSISAGENCWTFNATGLTHLNSGDTPAVVLLFDADADDSAPSWSSNVNHLQTFESADHASGNDPYLTTTEASDPRDNPTTTIVLPADEDDYDSIFDARYRVYTDVCYSEYGSEDPTFDFVVEYWDGDSWEAFTTWSEDYSDNNGLLINNGSCLSYGLGDIYLDPLIRDLIPSTTDYQIKVRSTFTSTGSYTAFNQFYLPDLLVPVGSSGGGSWDDADVGGSESDYDTELDSIWTGKPTCSVFGSSLFWESGGSTGTGIACVGEWVRFMIIPQSDTLLDYISQPMEMLETRWPFSYITEIVYTIEEGVGDSTTCPMPSLFTAASDDFEMGTGDGVDIATLDICSWFSPVAGYFEANQDAEDVFVVVVYLLLAVAVFRTAKRFLTS